MTKGDMKRGAKRDTRCEIRDTSKFMRYDDTENKVRKRRGEAILEKKEGKKEESEEQSGSC